MGSGVRAAALCLGSRADPRRLRGEDLAGLLADRGRGAERRPGCRGPGHVGGRGLYRQEPGTGPAPRTDSAVAPGVNARRNDPMTQPSACPDPASLRSLLQGALPAEEQARLTGHLDTCVTCQKT